MTPAAPSPDPAAEPAPAPVPARLGGQRPPRDTRQSASALIDEAAHRLRLAPIGTLGIYYAGSLPFALALLYFWADMSRSADAAEHSAISALVVAVLFLTMKAAHAVFAARLRAQFAREPMPRWTAARLGRVLLVQTGLHAPGLFVLSLSGLVFMLPIPYAFAFLLALALTLPIGWEYAFYQNVTALGDGAPGVTAREIIRRAWQHTLARPGANHAGLSILGGLALFVWLNLLISAFLLPQLIKMFTGEENAVTNDPLSLLNTTLFAVSGVLVYLVVDPLVKTFYTLRCFYEDSARTGEDLLAELRALPPLNGAPTSEPGPSTAVPGMAVSAPRAGAAALARASLLLVLCGLAAIAPSLTAAPLPTSSTPPPVPFKEAPRTVSPPALDRSIHDVLSRREFTWRSPRPPVARDANTNQGPIGRFLDSVGTWIKAQTKKVGDWFNDLWEKIRRWTHRDEPVSAPSAPSVNPAPLMRPTLYVVAALLALGVIYLIWSGARGWRRTARLDGRTLDPDFGKTLPPDLSAEDVLATQLPEDEWLALARRLLESGERRLALRALYLSLLAGLGARGLLVVARHKSNRDYFNELRRRTRDRPELPGAFGRSVRAFERVWYGSDAVDDGLLASFEADRVEALG